MHVICIVYIRIYDHIKNAQAIPEMRLSIAQAVVKQQ